MRRGRNNRNRVHLQNILLGGANLHVLEKLEPAIAG